MQMSRNHALDTKEAVCVVQFDNRPLALHEPKDKDFSWLPEGKNGERLPYWVLGAAANYAYAVEKGYDYIRIQKDGPCLSQNAQKLACEWCKVEAMLLAMKVRPKADWYIFLDSDAYFSNRSMSLNMVLEEAFLIDKKCEDALLIVTSEPPYGCSRVLSRHFKNSAEFCRAHSGVQLWRNKGYAHDILSFWWSMSDNPVAKRFWEGWPMEQGVLAKWVVDKYNESIAILHPHQVPHPDQEFIQALFNYPNGRYIQHFWGSSPKRVPAFKARLLQLYNENFLQKYFPQNRKCMPFAGMIQNGQIGMMELNLTIRILECIIPQITVIKADVDRKHTLRRPLQSDLSAFIPFLYST